jgi:hypothetical protein
MIIFEEKTTRKLYSISKEKLEELELVEQELVVVNNTTNQHICVPLNNTITVLRKEFEENFSLIKVRESDWIMEEARKNIKF